MFSKLCLQWYNPFQNIVAVLKNQAGIRFYKKVCSRYWLIVEDRKNKGTER
jgi:predicted acetyltransferase